MLQKMQGSIRNPTDAHLQAGAVFHQSGNMLTDTQPLVIQLRQSKGDQWRLVHKGYIDITEVQESIAVGARHSRIDMGNDPIRHFAGGYRGLDRYPQGTVAMAVRW